MEELSEKQDVIPMKHNIHNTTEYTREPFDSDSSSSRSSVDNLKAKKSKSINKKWALKRITPFTDSDSDSDSENVQYKNDCQSDTTSRISKTVSQDDDDSGSDYSSAKDIPRKSRIQKNILSDSEDSGSEVRPQAKLPPASNSDDEMKNGNSDSDNAVKNEEQQLRLKNKQNKLKDKFKGLLTVRNKESKISVEEAVNKADTDESSNDSEAETASIDKIKQKFLENMAFKPSICDPDTSDEESSQQKSVYKQKKERKTKLTSPKPQRMSAKQAMENMQKIKSESNRMLREKEVSLPYHRPKAISLKDIMSRRKLAVSSDGKTLPVKMNKEQLKHYAKMLEEKQKEMLELCRSESEEEEENEEDSKDTNTDNVIDKAVTETNNEIEKSVTSLDVTNEFEKETETVENDSTTKETEQESESMRLVYDETANSFEESNITVTENKKTDKDAEMNSISYISNNLTAESKPDEVVCEQETEQKNNTEDDSQLISLQFDTKNTDTTIEDTDASTMNEVTADSLNDHTTSADRKEDTEKENEVHKNPVDAIVTINNSQEAKSNAFEDMDVDNFSDEDDMNIEDIDKIIENAETIKNIEDKVNSQFLVRDKPLNLNPKLTGSPGMLIDLDDSGTAPRKSGVELLKERFTYFSKLKTPEEIKREREKKIKPGSQLKKLKQELEEKIAEQRSLEWAKRLEEEKQQQHELKVLRGEESEDDIDKIEAALEGKEEVKEDTEDSESGEEEPEENDIELKDKPRKKNAMVDDEAVESECEDENDDNDENIPENNENLPEDGENPDENPEDDKSESESESESSESEEEQTVTKKGRILKAFEDSDDEDIGKDSDVIEIKQVKGTADVKSGSSDILSSFMSSQVASQDEDIQLAQRPISSSDDLFPSQEGALTTQYRENKDASENDETFTQTFSILESSKQHHVEIDLNISGTSLMGNSQPLDSSVEDIAFQPTGSQDLHFPSQIPTTQSQSQSIGEDILAMCTGQFYDNQFVSQVEDKPPPLANAINYDAFDNYQSQESQDDVNKENGLEIDADRSYNDNEKSDKDKENSPIDSQPDNFIELKTTPNEKEKIVDDNLKSILDELADPEFDVPKPNKYFLSSDRNSEVQLKRKLVIDSDDETGNGDSGESKKRKKLKKKRPEKRALQISDDEEELSEQEEAQSEQEEAEEYESDIEEEAQDRLVEYDSEENEIEIKPQKAKKARKMAEFFENEAELTSEDEWAGSGDEDEAGLDRMEREEGDQEVFHQGELQKELGQIHMRDVLDQDKREVRLLQELLFEDGDLGGGGRQRRFKWSNMGEEETGTVPDELADTQEEEFESEEQWRKQRHEREMFLRQLQNNDAPDESLNVTVNRTTIIKGNLLSKTMSTILMEATEHTDTTVSTEKTREHTPKDVPSPKKPFGLLQSQYRGSLLSRGSGALARLAALATPLAADEDRVGSLGPSTRRNFVFAALMPEDKPKVAKRKAESNPSTPKLVKKIRTEEKNAPRSSLLDHLKL